MTDRNDQAELDDAGADQYPATRPEILDAQQAAAAAAASGARPDTCPYKAGETEHDRFLRLVWLRSYRHALAERAGGHTALGAGGQD